MALTSPRMVSPFNSSRNGESIPSYISPPRFNSGLPLQQSVSSASPMPASPRVASISALPSNQQYIDQIRAVIEQQRQLHEKERALWNTENQALQEKVTQLEASLRWYKERNGGSGVISPLDDLSGTTFGTFGGFPPGSGSKPITASTGDEFWRGAGGKSDAVPTRTFSDPTASIMKQENKQMPSIPEDAISHHPGRALSADMNMPPLGRPHHTVGPFDHNIDGIIFKPTALAVPPATNGMTPTDSPSPGHSPGVIQFHPTTLARPDDPYLKDAGHTPLARGTLDGLDGTASGTASPPTPLPHGELERPPLAPRPSVARPPNERSDSYFPPPGIDPVDEDDEDTALTGPLGLRNNEVEDQSFLDEVSSKLRDVARSQAFSPEGGSEAGGEDGKGDRKGRGGGRGDEFEAEVEPRLRIKRSMNFGSSWGARSCGRGF